MCPGLLFFFSTHCPVDEHIVGSSSDLSDSQHRDPCKSRNTFLNKIIGKGGTEMNPPDTLVLSSEYNTGRKRCDKLSRNTVLTHPPGGKFTVVITGVVHDLKRTTCGGVPRVHVLMLRSNSQGCQAMGNQLAPTSMVMNRHGYSVHVVVVLYTSGIRTKDDDHPFFETTHVDHVFKHMICQVRE
jgi:hypothetical protein